MTRLEEFDRAVEALAAASLGAEFGRADFAPLTGGLGRYLRAAFPGLGREEILDLISIAIERFIAAVQAGRLDTRQRPAAYLTRIAQRAALDELAAQRRLRSLSGHVESAAPGRDELEPLLGAIGGAEQVRVLRERALLAGREELIELVDVYLSLATAGRQPTLREIGHALGISHTEVRLRLDELAAMAS